jgi:hypothetical protein
MPAQVLPVTQRFYAESSYNGCKETANICCFLGRSGACYQHHNRYTGYYLCRTKLKFGSGGNRCTGSLSYNWSSGAGNTASVSVSPANSTNYTVTVTDACGATVSSTVALTVNPAL